MGRIFKNIQNKNLKFNIGHCENSPSCNNPELQCKVHILKYYIYGTFPNSDFFPQINDIEQQEPTE